MGHTPAPVRDSHEALRSIPPQKKKKIKLNTCKLEFGQVYEDAHVRVTVARAGLRGDCCAHQEKKYCWKGQGELYLPRQEKAQLAR